MTTVVAVVGTIPGAGTTTVVSALGAALGEQRQRVALVDATAEGSRIADVISIAGGGDLTDALRRGTTLGDVQGTGPHDVTAFPADPDTGWGSIRPDAVASFYEQLRGRFAFALVDCGSSLSPASSAWLGHADEAVIVTDPDVAGTVPETAALAGAFSVPVRGVLANRVPPKGVDDALEALAATGQPALGALPEDRTVGAAEADGISVLRAEPDSQIATCAWDLARRFRTGEHDDPVVPFRVAQSGNAAPDDGGDDATTAAAGGSEPDPSAEESTDRVDDSDGREADSDDSEDDSNERDGATAGGATSESPDPAAAPPATTGSSTDETSGTASPDPVAADDGEDDPPANDDPAPDDPFTAIDPQPVAESADDTAPADGATTGDASADRDDSASDEPLDGLLGDVRSRMDGTADAGSTSSGETGDDAPDSTADDERSGDEEPAADRAPAADETGDDAAALSDEDIESVFEETIDRERERREPDAEDGGEDE